MTLQTKLLIILVLLGIVDAVIPIPFFCILLIYVVLEKPAWFLEKVRLIYADAPHPDEEA